MTRDKYYQEVCEKALQYRHRFHSHDPAVDHDDLAQEAVLKALKDERTRDIRDPSLIPKVVWWAMASIVCHEHGMVQRRCRHRSVDESRVEGGSSEAVPVPYVEPDPPHHEEWEHLAAIIGTLPGISRLVVAALVLQGMTKKDTEAAFGLSSRGVGTALNQARDCIEGRGGVSWLVHK